MDVLNDDKSDLSIIDHMGGDHSVVRAARVSYSKDDQEWRGDRDVKLLQYMADNGHTTPFEHTAVTFHVSCPLFVRSQWHRHRMWSYNEVSRRYTSEDLDFYFPHSPAWRLQDTKNKQSSTGKLWDEDAKLASDLTSKSINMVWLENVDLYNQILAAGVGREQARMFLPQNMYTRFYATTNLHSIAKFINVRADEHAQWEIRQYAISMREQVRKLFPVSIAALCDPKPEPEPEAQPWWKFW